MDGAKQKLRPNRSAGVLLHPTSLPGPFGIGDLGPVAYAWIDALAHAKQTWWQLLPLGPTGYGDSPYQSFSSFAGNPFLISPELLARDGLLFDGDLGGTNFPADRVDYGPVIEYKLGLLGRAWEHFLAGRAPQLRQPFDAFRVEHRGWLDDYALFMALKDAHGGKAWSEWEPELVLRDPAALERARTRVQSVADAHRFRQFLFFRQWGELRRYAEAKNLRMIGDVPIFVAGDSADVWASPELFHLDARRRPTHVAGVPPDYFSATGQLWGNPLYKWEAHRATGYVWWINRLRAILGMVDLVRLDHFRGFEAYWEIPAGQPTAQVGRWVTGPGADLLHALREGLGGRLPLIAEDLGLITPPVEALRDQFRLPGMRILQFAFAGATEDRFLPHNYDFNTVVYTGTHDNDTTRGWFEQAQPKEAELLRRYIPQDGQPVSWQLTRLAWASVADYAVVPLQDILDLGTEARMNYPGKLGNNWSWRLLPDQLTREHIERLGDLTDLYSRSE